MTEYLCENNSQPGQKFRYVVGTGSTPYTEASLLLGTSDNNDRKIIAVKLYFDDKFTVKLSVPPTPPPEFNAEQLAYLHRQGFFPKPEEIPRYFIGSGIPY